MTRRRFLKTIGTVGSISLVSGCGAKTDQYAFEEIRTFDYESGINKFEIKIDAEKPIKIDPNYTPVFTLLSPDNTIKLTNIRDVHPPDNQLGSDRQGYTIDNVTSSGNHQLVIGHSGYGGTVSVSQSSHPQITQAERRDPIKAETLVNMTWEESEAQWEIDRLREDNWRRAEESITNREEITEYLTPSETQVADLKDEKGVLEEVIESNNLDLNGDQQKTYQMLVLTRKIYSILEQMRSSLQGIVDRIVSIFLQVLYIKFGDAYTIIEEPLRESIRDAIINRLSVGMGPIVSETENEVIYIMFLTGTSSFTMRDPTTGQEIAPALPEVDITAKMKVNADIDTYLPYEVSPKSAELYDEMILVETGG